MKVTGPDDLEWNVRRLFFPAAMRPPARSDIVEMASYRRVAILAPTGPTPLGSVLILLLLPALPFVVAARGLGLLPWTVEARTYPFGRRQAPLLFRYAVYGRVAAARAVDEIAAAIRSGDGAPAPVDA